MLKIFFWFSVQNRETQNRDGVKLVKHKTAKHKIWTAYLLGRLG